MKKIALFVFNGDPMCFIHVLLNALDMKNQSMEVKIIMEGSSVKLIPELAKTGNPLNQLWENAVEQNIVGGVCKACSNKLGTLEDAKKQGLTLLDDISGHPAISVYKNNGFEIITF
jgi:hypothetical protein